MQLNGEGFEESAFIFGIFLSKMEGLDASPHKRRRKTRPVVAEKIVKSNWVIRRLHGSIGLRRATDQ